MNCQIDDDHMAKELKDFVNIFIDRFSYTERGDLKGVICELTLRLIE